MLRRNRRDLEERPQSVSVLTEEEPSETADVPMTVHKFEAFPPCPRRSYRTTGVPGFPAEIIMPGLQTLDDGAAVAFAGLFADIQENTGIVQTSHGIIFTQCGLFFVTWRLSVFERLLGAVRICLETPDGSCHGCAEGSGGELTGWAVLTIRENTVVRLVNRTGAAVVMPVAAENGGNYYGRVSVAAL